MLWSSGRKRLVTHFYNVLRDPKAEIISQPTASNLAHLLRECQAESKIYLLITSLSQVPRACQC